ncbi:tRNA (adenosine(37)-N6)-threonylcarbamoyltransferase complex ATPase subunit type 1 TsaE [Filimonas effusa]|uniref:tRNA threonylcarbamoyladenosine biosynthesis protein TsaE n=1 Tax=Filimonas effusa TaxID=2508721 RepID=A0A4Q1D385_9BACT|nr:tRNA (adenosine(37)-N6)-threonylcarbamoyltransferase complex ATPase subunit type 1 TsaE [Filimonas effusa]RXK81872.1 tRNA (adenosine(37)-N6)-threonylcarbamoyltransferase complex ATPase subunit type 1 TsaE [Filimonas effusa]
MELNYELSQAADTAAAIWDQYGQYSVWAFHGELGAGKTTFIHALCSLLNVKDTVSSPTFALINEYRSANRGSIYHMDWYRLKDEEEAIQAGIEDCLYSGSLCLVEWPEKAAGLLPDDTVHIYLETTGPHTRRIVINN